VQTEHVKTPKNNFLKDLTPNPQKTSITFNRSKSKINHKTVFVVADGKKAYTQIVREANMNRCTPLPFISFIHLRVD
jgi:hypothetical protein